MYGKLLRIRTIGLKRNEKREKKAAPLHPSVKKRRRKERKPNPTGLNKLFFTH